MKKDFSLKSQIEQVYETDKKIRSRIMKIYNKQRDDFDTEDEFNLYLEEVEDIIFNLVEGIDIQATEAKINEYKRSNKRNIAVNMTKREEERKKMYAKVRNKDIELREENKQFYDEEEVLEEKVDTEAQAQENRFAMMAEQMELSQKQQEFNSILYVHKINSLKIPKVKAKPEENKSEIESEEHALLARRAAGFSSKWMYNRCLHEIRSCIRSKRN